MNDLRQILLPIAYPVKGGWSTLPLIGRCTLGGIQSEHSQTAVSLREEPRTKNSTFTIDFETYHRI